MKQSFFLALAMALAGSLTWPAPALATDYTIDPSHSSVSFTIRHLATKVRGNFNTFSGRFKFDPKDLKKTGGVVEIDTASIDTNHQKRDDHLRSADFFNVEKHKSIKFEIKSVKQKGSVFLVNGSLTMNGITKPVVLEASYLGEQTDPWGNKASSFAATTKVNRKDYGLNWNKTLEAGGLLVGDDVEIELNIEATPASTPTPK